MMEEVISEITDPSAESADETEEDDIDTLNDISEEEDENTNSTITNDLVEVDDNTLDDDSFKNVPPQDYPCMLFRMRNNYPLAIHAHEHVCTLLRWKKSKPDLEMEILAPEGDYKKGIIFFHIHEGYFNGSVYCHNTREKKAFQKALLATKKVPIHEQYKMCRLTCMTYCSYKSVMTHLPSKNWCISEDVVLWLPWYCARDIEVNLPRGVEVRELTLEHADIINETWPFRYPGSKELIADMIRINFGSGVFRKDELLSWAVRWINGNIGIIQTVENEKGKGFCRAAVEALTQLLGKYLSDVHLTITGANRRHITYFIALGFKYGFTSYTAETKKLETETNEPVERGKSKLSEKSFLSTKQT